MNKTDRFLIIGHRGAAAYAHENTIASLEEAISRHADMVEFDVRGTADGILVLHHDRTIKTEIGRRPVSKLSFNQLQEAARLNGFAVAKFADIVKRFGPTIPVNIEIKVRGFAPEIVSILEKYRPAYPPVISSFFPWVLGRVKTLNGTLATGLIVGREQAHRFGFLGRPMLKLLAQNIGISSLHLQDSIIDSRKVKSAHDLGMRLFAWTVDDEQRMRALIGLGVDGIITNRPDLLYGVCVQMSSEKTPLIRKARDEEGKFVYAGSRGEST
ncbi:MAG: hypothetical protein A2W25_02115 [candidate division Zixibacteria bacterium RBG_16_53_22]|nr:MAG: hypothetical protein A2W25_02115 [candidate division Zixibacteria bacterium RBG_16_53_22]